MTTQFFFAFLPPTPIHSLGELTPSHPDQRHSDTQLRSSVLSARMTQGNWGPPLPWAWLWGLGTFRVYLSSVYLLSSPLTRACCLVRLCLQPRARCWWHSRCLCNVWCGDRHVDTWFKLSFSSDTLSQFHIQSPNWVPVVAKLFLEAFEGIQVFEI